jgi:hypothetical protein
VKKTVREDDPHVMYEFSCDRGEYVPWIKSVPTQERHVIPDWYIKAL